MAQFDVYARVGRTKSYVVDLQADLLDQLTLRVIAPMVISSTTAVISGLTPLVPFQGNEYIVLMYQCAAVPAWELRRRRFPLCRSGRDQAGTGYPVPRLLERRARREEQAECTLVHPVASQVRGSQTFEPCFRRSVE